MIGTSRRPTATVTNTISPVTASSRAVGQQFGAEPDLASCGGLVKSTRWSGLASQAFGIGTSLPGSHLSSEVGRFWLVAGGRGCGVAGGGITLELALDQFARGCRP